MAGRESRREKCCMTLNSSEPSCCRVRVKLKWRAGCLDDLVHEAQIRRYVELKLQLMDGSKVADLTSGTA